MQEVQTLNTGISPCPNDTYIFGAWILGLISDLEGCRTRFFWEDVQHLNEWAGAAKCQVLKVSASQALDVQDRYFILSSGGAFGMEHGPKLVARKGLVSRPQKIAVPGLHTTAYALLRAALPHAFDPLPMSFDHILDFLKQGRADAGLLIHESALLHKEYGLEVLLDLGRWWREQTHGLPIPLGCIVAHKELGSFFKVRLEEQIRRSLDTARERGSEIKPLVAQMAQELDSRVIDRHIEAYVNAYSRDMGSQGREALRVLQEMKKVEAEAAQGTD